MKKIEEIKILVLGDIMVDKYIIGSVDRMAQEAPVPIVKVKNEYRTLGGAGNVVKNLSTLGVNVTFFGCCGDDDNGSFIKNELEKLMVNHYMFKTRECTIEKKRIIEENRGVMMLRVDREDFIVHEADFLIEGDFDYVIVSDYGKGFINSFLMEKIERFTDKLIIDPHSSNYTVYKKAFLIVPNEKEEEFGRRKSLELKYKIITMGKRGMLLVDYSDNLGESKETYIPTEEVEVYNVTGAGDTVVSILSLCLSLGLSVYESAIISNDCANYVVQKSGTSVVPKDIFLEIFEKRSGITL